MTAFEVKDMTCGYCAGTITNAVNAIDASAKVALDISRNLVTIEPDVAVDDALAGAIREAGCAPVFVPASGSNASASKSCCGHCR